MTRGAAVWLPDGRRLEYEIRFSPVAKTFRLKITAREGLVVVAPKGLGEQRIMELVDGRRDWIAAKLVEIDAVRHLISKIDTPRPEAFDLPALGESWRVEYRQTKAGTVGARTDMQGRVLVYGMVGDHERCKEALRRWLARRAKEVLAQRLEVVSADTGLKFSGLTIKSQRTRWGSCSVHGVVSLNCKLLFLSKDLVRYVLAHELCHLLEPNHTRRFWAHLRQLEPMADTLHGQIRDAWKQVPPWAHPPRMAPGGTDGL